MSDANSVMSYLDNKIDEHREMMTRAVVKGGQVKDYAEYQRLCGVVQGLDFVKQIIADLAKRLETDPDDAD